MFGYVSANEVRMIAHAFGNKHAIGGSLDFSYDGPSATSWYKEQYLQAAALHFPRPFAMAQHYASQIGGRSFLRYLDVFSQLIETLDPKDAAAIVSWEKRHSGKPPFSGAARLRLHNGTEGIGFTDEVYDRRGLLLFCGDRPHFSEMSVDAFGYIIDTAFVEFEAIEIVTELKAEEIDRAQAHLRAMSTRASDLLTAGAGQVAIKRADAAISSHSFTLKEANELLKACNISEQDLARVGAAVNTALRQITENDKKSWRNSKEFRLR
jgi:hypothetical protein